MLEKVNYFSLSCNKFLCLTISEKNKKSHAGTICQRVWKIMASIKCLIEPELSYYSFLLVSQHEGDVSGSLFPFKLT